MKHHHQNIASWYYCSGVYRLNICDAWHTHNYDWDALTDQVQSLLHFYSAKPCSQQIPAELLFIRLPKWIKILLIPIVLLNCTVKMRNFVLFAHTYIYIYIFAFISVLFAFIYIYIIYIIIFTYFIYSGVYILTPFKRWGILFSLLLFIFLFIYIPGVQEGFVFLNQSLQWTWPVLRIWDNYPLAFV